MQADVQRALPSAVKLSALLPGLYTCQTRSKVYTSNVMDETRAKRIKDHFDYMKARKQYSLTVHDLFGKWRAEFKNQDITKAASERQRKAQELRDEAERLQELLKEKRVDYLKDQLRRVELEHKKAVIQVQRARRREEERAQVEEARAARYRLLLEASRHWIRQEELEVHIHKALDNPQPFGFIANIVPTKGF